MPLGKAVVGSNHTPQIITIQDPDGAAYDLSTSALTGKLENTNTGVARVIDGTLAFVTDGSDGKVTWTYGTNDIGTAGVYWCQILFTFPSGKVDVTEKTEFIVLPSITVTP